VNTKPLLLSACLALTVLFSAALQAATEVIDQVVAIVDDDIIMASELRERVPEGFLLVTPGIRPVDSSQDDQRRVLTPAEAIRRGSDYLVIGRPITAHPDPLQRLREINASL